MSLSSDQAVRARWTAFLDKIETRFNELVGGAQQSLPELVDLSGFDLTPFSNALTAVRVQCQELTHKIDITWSSQVEAAFEQALGDGAPARAQIDQERKRGEQLALKLALALRSAEVGIAADAAERVVAEARKILAKEFKCSHCGAPLAVREQFFRSYYVNCQFCRTVNTFEPGMVARMVEHFAVHALAERDSLEENIAYLMADHRYRRSRGPTSEKVRLELVEAYRVFVDKYLGERIRWLPDLAKNLEKDRRARMDSFIDSVA